MPWLGSRARQAEGYEALGDEEAGLHPAPAEHGHHLRPDPPHAHAPSAHEHAVCARLLWHARQPPCASVRALRSSAEGLTEAEAAARLRNHGLNAVAATGPPAWYRCRGVTGRGGWAGLQGLQWQQAWVGNPHPAIHPAVKANKRYPSQPAAPLHSTWPAAVATTQQTEGNVATPKEYNLLPFHVTLLPFHVTLLPFHVTLLPFHAFHPSTPLAAPPAGCCGRHLPTPSTPSCCCWRGRRCPRKTPPLPSSWWGKKHEGCACTTLVLRQGHLHLKQRTQPAPAVRLLHPDAAPSLLDPLPANDGVCLDGAALLAGGFWGGARAGGWALLICGLSLPPEA